MAAPTSCRRLAVSAIVLLCVSLLQLAQARLLREDKTTLDDSKSFSIKGGSGEGGGRGFGISIGHGGHDVSIAVGGGLGGGAGTTRGGGASAGGGSGGGVGIDVGRGGIDVGIGGGGVGPVAPAVCMQGLELEVGDSWAAQWSCACYRSRQLDRRTRMVAMNLTLPLSHLLKFAEILTDLHVDDLACEPTIKPLIAILSFVISLVLPPFTFAKPFRHLLRQHLK
ncbi:hypothetical protein TRIUR3_21939 [Triticum urartu]|uniref:Uncharacterized protein n=1 Tax=Triticum urartu TaxID=4572 RepID=M7ZKY3_TRIUA|nr:hypothetical protein TRIUR3_21939 [Triticum urartu]